MTTAGKYIPLIQGELASLKHECRMFQRSIKDSVIQAESYLQSIENPDDLDLQRALEPFFQANLEDSKSFSHIVIDCFYKVFTTASTDFFPSYELTQAILQCLLTTEYSNNDDLNLTCCNVCIACLQSPSGVYYAHGRLLAKMFRLMFVIYNVSENQNTFNAISQSINQTLMALFNAYTLPLDIPKCASVEDLSRKVTTSIVQNAQMMASCIDFPTNNYVPNLRDVDVYVVLSLLSRIIEKNKMKTRSIKLATSFLCLALKQDSAFFQTAVFQHLLQTKIHIALISLCIDNRMELAENTASLIKVVWKRFAFIYLEGLNEVFDKGLATSLFSPDSVVLLRTITVIEKCVEEPQLMVDAFVNYDCDKSGHFQNVFENVIDKIVKLSYPDSQQTTLQKKALDAIVTLLQSLWDYFANFQVSGNPNSEPEATPQDFLEAKRSKDFFNQGCEIFKKSFKKGLAFFQEYKFVTDSPADIAKFFFTTPQLDPVSVGEMLGGHTDICKATLHEFANLFDFKGMTFEAGFRLFLSKFMVPGEAQMIDRIMEEFGTKFYNDNSTLFSTADTVYALAFSALMLHTDAHHPNVKSRMTLAQFIANNRGIDNGQDMPEEFLESLYNGITSKEIFVPSSSMPNSSLLTREQRADLYKQQCQKTLTDARNHVEHELVFHRSESPMFIGPMFNAVWRGPLATLTMTFEQSEDPTIYKKCLEGLALCVHIASHCFIESALDTLVDSFSKFTGLRKKNLSEVKMKNIECTNALLNIALEDRNFLRGAWEIVMGEVSALDKMKGTFHYDIDLVDQLYSQSSQLDRESIADFVRAVVMVSKQELAEQPPRLYMLQRLGIIAHFNMKRPRYVWNSIWHTIGDHLCDAGCNPDFEIASVAVDILRQLSGKFMIEQELTQFHFQKNFLLPFLQIFEKDSSLKIKELILSDLGFLIAEKTSTIQSGWEIILQILIFSSYDETVQSLGFDLLNQIFEKRITDLQGQLLYAISTIKCFFYNCKAVHFLEDLAAVVPKDDSGTWLTLFEALVSAGQSTTAEIRVEAHNVFISIIGRLESEEVLRQVLESIVIEMITPVNDTREIEEFYSEVRDFICEFIKVVINRFDVLNAYQNSFLSVLRSAILGENLLVSAAGINSLVELIKTVKLNEDLLHETAIAIGKDIDKMSPVNACKFIESLYELIDVLPNEKFVDVFEMVKEPDLIASISRKALLRWHLRIGDKDKIASTISQTCALFVEKEYLKDNQSEEGISWNGAVEEAVNALNEMNDDDFRKCFAVACGPLLELISAFSKSLRSEVKKAIERRLL